MKREDVIKHYWCYGQQLISGMNEISKDLNLENYFYVEGYPCSPNYVTKDKDKNNSLLFRTLFSQCMLDKSIMMPYIAISFAHQEKELNMTLEAVQYSLIIYKKALEEGSDNYLKSKIIKPVFRKHN